MALVLTVNEVNLTAPFTNDQYMSVKINGVIYVATASSLYIFDDVNRIYRLIYTFPHNIATGMMESIGKYIYFCTSNGSYGFRFFGRYNIDTGIFTETWKQWFTSSYNNSYTTHICCWKGSDNNSIRVSMFGSDSGTTGYARRGYIITEDGITSSVPTYSPLRQQITDSYYFGRIYPSGGIYYTTSTDYGRINNIDLPASVLGSRSENTGYYGSFEFNGDIYLIKNGVNVVKYNKAGNFFNTLDIILSTNSGTPFVMEGRDNSFYVQGLTKLYIFQFIDYNLTYNIKSNNELETYVTLTGQSPITKIQFNNYLGSTTVGYNFETISGDITGDFEIEIPENKQLLGFALQPNSTRVLFYTNNEYTYNITTDTTFYPVFGTYRPITESFNINTYKNSAENNRIDKTDYLTSVGTISGALRDETSITDLVITFQQTTVPTFNYVYIPIFNRYYFVTDVRSIRYKLWEINLSVDVLMTYKNAIYSCSGFIDRNEFEHDNYLIDKKRVIDEGEIIEVSTVTNDLFDPGLGSYVLSGLMVTTGGIVE